jgi:hypothetical protein
LVISDTPKNTSLLGARPTTCHAAVERLLSRALVEAFLGLEFDETISLARAVTRSEERRAA